MRRLIVPLHAAARVAGAAARDRRASPLAHSPAPSRLAAACAYVSGIAAAAGVVLLVAEVGMMVAAPTDARTLRRLGDAHCASLLVQYGSAIPIALLFHRQNRSIAADRSLAVTALAVIAMTSIVGMQALALAGLLEPIKRTAYFAIAIGVLAMWFVAVGRLGRSSGVLRDRTVMMSLLGASYVAYPIWAFWLGRQLREPPSLAKPTTA